MSIQPHTTRTRVATIWLSSALPLRQGSSILSKSRCFVLVASLLLLSSAGLFLSPAFAQRMVRIKPAALPATLIQMDSKAAFIMFQARGHRWKRNLTLAVLLKAGKRATATVFHPGEQIILLSTFDNFNRIDTLADRPSYAAFCHDLAYIGTVQSWQSDHSVLLAGANVYRGKEKPEAPSRFNEKHVQIRPETQIWLNGEKRTLAYARKSLVAGTELYVAVRWRDYKHADSLPAHALFDWQTWQAYARYELRTAKDLYLPLTPQYRRTKD